MIGLGDLRSLVGLDDLYSLIGSGGAPASASSAVADGKTRQTAMVLPSRLHHGSAWLPLRSAIPCVSERACVGGKETVGSTSCRSCVTGSFCRLLLWPWSMALTPSLQQVKEVHRHLVAANRLEDELTAASARSAQAPGSLQLQQRPSELPVVPARHAPAQPAREAVHWQLLMQVL